MMSFQLRRKVGIQPHCGNRVTIQNRVEDHRRTLAAERQRARRHLVEHRSEREQVGARIQLFRPHLLRRHVGHRAQRRARTGQVLLSPSPVCVSALAICSTLPADVTLASPKSRILACPRLVTKMLAGLMSRWTMPSACAASSASAISMAERQQRLDLQRPAGDAVLQRHAVQKLHGDEAPARPARRSRKWCRCWDGSGRRRPAPRAGSAPEPEDLGRPRRAGTSARRSGASRVSSAL